MTSFYLSEKKFVKLAPHNRHKWLVKWLSDIYGKLCANRIDASRMEQVYASYAEVLGWMDLSPAPPPDRKDRRGWIEFVSDAVHFHRSAMEKSPRDHDLLPPVIRGDTGRKTPEKRGPDFHIALDSFRSLFNVGSVIRVCDAAGFQSVLVGGTLSGSSASVEKTAMGAEEWVRVWAADDLASALEEKKGQGYPVIGVETVERAVPYNRFEWPGKGVVVFGNEEYGISRHVMRMCDHFVKIPMHGHKNSINAANAAAVIAFHVTNVLEKPAGFQREEST